MQMATRVDCSLTTELLSYAAQSVADHRYTTGIYRSDVRAVRAEGQPVGAVFARMIMTDHPTRYAKIRVSQAVDTSAERDSTDRLIGSQDPTRGNRTFPLAGTRDCNMYVYIYVCVCVCVCVCVFVY